MKPPIWLVVILVSRLLGEPEIGVGGFYHRLSMREVCERRNLHGWGSPLACDHYCLAATVDREALGEWWFVWLPGCGFEVCHIVDVARLEHVEELTSRGEVLEVSGAIARRCGWSSYVRGVITWSISDRSKSEFEISEIGSKREAIESSSKVYARPTRHHAVKLR